MDRLSRRKQQTLTLLETGEAQTGNKKAVLDLE
jgi:hypothetical protein